MLILTQELKPKQGAQKVETISVGISAKRTCSLATYIHDKKLSSTQQIRIWLLITKGNLYIHDYKFD